MVASNCNKCHVVKAQTFNWFSFTDDTLFWFGSAFKDPRLLYKNSSEDLGLKNQLYAKDNPCKRWRTSQISFPLMSCFVKWIFAFQHYITLHAKLPTNESFRYHFSHAFYTSHLNWSGFKADSCFQRIFKCFHGKYFLIEIIPLLWLKRENVFKATTSTFNGVW